MRRRERPSPVDRDVCACNSSKELIEHVARLGSPANRYEHWYIRGHFRRWKETIEFLHQRSIGFENVLDVGCGSGVFLLMLGKRAAGLDRPTEVEVCKQRGIEGYPIDLQWGRFPFPDCSFDLITCLEVIEHLEKPSLMLSEVRRVLKNQGSFVLSFPNARSLLWRSAGLLWLTPVWPWIRTRRWIPREERLQRHRHKRDYEVQELTALLRGHGFQDIESRGLKVTLSKNDNYLILAR